MAGEPDKTQGKAEEPGKSQGFNFSDFQKAFYDAWSFVFPNVLIMLLCIGTSYFAGNLNLSSLVPFSRILVWLRELSTFLNEPTPLFGSTLVPSLVFVVIGIAVLNVFQVLRTSVGSIVPPAIVIRPENMYRALAPRDLLVRIALKRKSIDKLWDLYHFICEWEQALVYADKTVLEAVAFKDCQEKALRWIQYFNGAKFLMLVAVISSAFGIITGSLHFAELWRLLVAILVLAGFGIYFTARHLLAIKQAALASLFALNDRLESDPESNWPSLLKERSDAIQQRRDVMEVKRNEDVLVQSLPVQLKRNWWSFAFFSVSLRDLVSVLFNPRGGVGPPGESGQPSNLLEDAKKKWTVKG